ncbi:MAG: phosphoribosyltransferase [Candidatus Micrarchaeota archaeon]|nr:phosphoribosyltransferase [Candidatus Micrarchaeota archaeon]
MEFIFPSWNKIDEMCKKLAREIRSSGFEPDFIVGVSRGGWVPARLLSDYLENPRLANIGIVFYKSAGKTMGKPKLTQRLDCSPKGKKVLIVDDVSDTGGSLMLVRKMIKERGAKDVRIATLHYKPHSKLKPEYFIVRTSAWVVYPWERNEFRKQMQKERASTSAR